MQGNIAIRVLVAGFWLLGVSAITIGSSNFLFGIATTAEMLSMVLGTLGLPAGDFSDLKTANTDNEFRFYAVFWVAYGIALIKTAMGLPTTLRWVLPLTSLFLVGGLGRILSIFAYGYPAPLFVLLMYVEFILCAVFLVAWFVARAYSPAS